MIERLSAIEMATKNELIEKEFYDKILETTSTPLGTSIFERLSLEEKVHYEGVQELYQQVKELGKLPDELPRKLQPTSVLDILENLILDTAQLQTLNKDDLENLRRSLVLEEKVTAFYEKLLGDMSEPGMKALFELFAKTERKHLQFLKNTIEYVVKAGFVE